MTEVYRLAMLTHDDDSPDKCRERRRRRILMRRLASLPSPTPPTATGILMDPSSDLTRARTVKRQRSSDLDTKPDPHGISVSVSLPICRSSSFGDHDNDAAVAIDIANPTTRRESLDRLHREPLPLPVYGMMSVTGRSREMEDAVEVRTPLCFPVITRHLPVHFFGVFDGHGGAHVAALLRSKMPSFITDELMGLSCAAVASSVGSCSSKIAKGEDESSGEEGRWGSQWREAMKRAFQRADEVAVATCPCGAAGSQCSCQPMEVALGGSTAVVALLTPDHIVVGNCGDSRAVLCRGGEPVPLSVDHKPDRSDELARIQALGGRVIFLNGARVEGILAMSRAIGDKYLKPYVTAEPETTILRREPTDEFVIIASDGLWDVLTNELACDITSQCLREGSPHPGVDLNVSGTHQEEENAQLLYPSRSALAAALLTRLALGRKSSDNISVIVVDLKRS